MNNYRVRCMLRRKEIEEAGGGGEMLELLARGLSQP